MKKFIAIFIIIFCFNAFAEVAESGPTTYESPDIERSVFSLNLNLSCDIQRCLRRDKISWVDQKNYAIYRYFWTDQDDESSAKSKLFGSLNKCFSIKLKNFDDAGYYFNQGKNVVLYTGPKRNCE